MTSLRPRQLGHRGSVLASGFAIDLRLVAEPVARARILGLAPRGLQLFAAGAVRIALLREPQRIDCTRAPGAPLVRFGHALSAAPLAPGELASLALAQDSVVLIAGSVASVTPVRELQPLDLADLIDVSDFEAWTGLRTLGVVHAEPEPVAARVEHDVREQLGVGTLSPEAAALASEAGGDAPRGRAVVRVPWLSHWLAPLLLALHRVFGLGGVLSLLQRLFGARKREQPEVPPTRQEPRGEPWLSRLAESLRRFGWRALRWTRLLPLFGARHARYFENLLEMFDGNRLDEALRHALPLDTAGKLGATRAPLFGPPAPRSNLELSVRSAHGPGPTLGLGQSLFDELRARYRRAFEQLAERGEIAKAAFVLVELLHAPEEAVAFLERHGQLRLAAELAEGREMAPGLVIRQWFLAGERKRAIAIARRTGAYADAVVRLGTTHREQADMLRLLWANTLASSGAYAAAVDAAWPVESARRLAHTWIDKAIEIGGVGGATMLARKARIVPEAFADTRERTLALLRERDEEGSTLARAFGRELLAGAATREVQTLAKATARRLLGDGAERDAQQLVQALLHTCGDAALSADARAARPDIATSRLRSIRFAACAHQELAAQAVNTDCGVLTWLDDTQAAPRTSHTLEGDARKRPVLFGVIVGEWGLYDGDLLSQAPVLSAARQITASLREATPAMGPETDSWTQRQIDALQIAHKKHGENGSGPCLCVTLATLWRGRLLIAHVGNTRAYLLRDRALRQVTTDHTLANDPAFLSVPAAERRETYEQVIIRALGTGGPMPQVDLLEVELRHGDTLLLCSNRIQLPDAVIARALSEHDSPRAACDALGVAARRTGAHANLTLVVARFGAQLPPPSGVEVAPRPVLPVADASCRLATVVEPVQFQRPAGDRGALPVLDAAQTPDGRMLVALGELGVLLLSRDGRVQRRFGQPAERIVISDHGDRAILIAARGEACRLSRLDLGSGRVQSWCDATIDRFARSFDGSSWLVARKGTAYLIDATADGWAHLWRVEETGAIVADIVRDPERACLHFAYLHGHDELWSLEPPTMTLRERRALDVDDLTQCAMNARGDFAGSRAGKSDRFVACAWSGSSFAEFGQPSTRPPSLELAQDWIAAQSYEDNAATVRLFDARLRQERARILLQGLPHGGGMRFQGDHFLVFDSLGRVLVLSLRSGALLREFRIRDVL